MKKKLGLIFSSLALVVVMIATLCACSTFGGIKKAFEKEGYKESEDVPAAQEQIVKGIFGEDADSYLTVHVFTKTIGNTSVPSSVATIVEFKSTKEMEDKLKELADDEVIGGYVKQSIDNLQKCDIVNGNCVLVSGYLTGCITIFKNA